MLCTDGCFFARMMDMGEGMSQLKRHVLRIIKNAGD
jgi:hypothetical protein